MSSLDLEHDPSSPEDEGVEYGFDDLSPETASPRLTVIKDAPTLNGGW